jgi:acetyl-CoA acetyltransferase
MSTASFRDVAIVAPTTIGYHKSPAHSVAGYVATALRGMLSACGLRKEDLDGLVLASYRNAPDNAATTSNQLELVPRFVADLPYGGASGVMALRRAARAVQAGDAQVVACIGADVPPPAGDTGANFSGFWRDHVHPYGAGGFNAVFSLITDAYAKASGLGRQDFGRLCVAQRANARRCQHPLLRSPMGMDDYLAAPLVTSTLGLFDCVMRCSGAEGVLVMPVERARDLALPHAVMAAAVERHNAGWQDDVQVVVGLPQDAEQLFRLAGVGHADIHFAEVYDDYPVMVMLQLESLCFCRPGQAARFLAGRDLSVTGDFPLNTSGGMLSCGQAGAAGSFLGVTEAVRQLTGAAVGNQVPGARRGLVSCYGCVSFERGVSSSAAILESAR